MYENVRALNANPAPGCTWAIVYAVVQLQVDVWV